MKKLLLMAVIYSLLTACGQSGSLYLPETSNETALERDSRE